MSSEAVTPTTIEDAAGASPATNPTERANYWLILDRWLENASEHFNPILVKETRQALKSQQFVLWFLLLLAACWIVTIGGIAWLGPGVQYASSGGVMFLAYYFVLSVTLIVVVPFAAYRSLAAEQEDNTRDVLMVSALSPSQLIAGKIGSAVLQMIVYLSALSPCLAFSYLLRGIDMATMLLLPLLAVLVSLGMSTFALLLASSAQQRYAQVLSSVGFVAVLLGAFAWTFTGAVGMVQGGSYMMRQSGFWTAAGVFANVYVCAVMLAYFGAAAMNTFTSANRSTALRRVLFFTQACFIGWIVAGWILSEYDARPLEYAAVTAWVFWGAAGSLLTGEQAVLSERVRRGLPNTALGRVLGTWFNPGPGTGYLFAIANVSAVTLLIVFGWTYSRSGQGLGFEFAMAFFFLGPCYVAAFLGIGRLVIAGLRKLAPLSLLGCFLVHFLLLLSAIGAPELLRSSMTRYGRLPFHWADLTSASRTLMYLWDGRASAGELATAVVVVAGAALCLFMVNVALAAREIRQTRAPLPQRVIEDEIELHPVARTVSNPWGDLRQPGTPG